MTNLTENETYESGIYQLEASDPVQGGPDGIDNRQAQQLANRTAWLKAQVAALGVGKAPLESPALTGAPTAPTPAAADSSTKIATTKFVGDRFSSFNNASWRNLFLSSQ